MPPKKTTPEHRSTELRADLNIQRAAHARSGVGFHGHIDVCEQCREHPFALCSVGARLLTEEADHD